jgi:hypothetical protein
MARRWSHRSIGKDARSQWPDKVGKGLMFISINVGATPAKLKAETEAAVDRLRAEFEGRGVHVREGRWGYRVVVVHDLDGNELFFPYPAEEDAPPAE